MHSLRRRSSLKDCDVAQLLCFHYVKPLPMNNLRAGSGSSSGSEGAFTPNLTPDFKNAAFPQSRGLWCGGPVRTALRKLQLNCYVDALVIITGATVTVQSLCVPAYFLSFFFLFFCIYHKRGQSPLQLIPLIASLWWFVVWYFTTCPKEVLSCQSAVSRRFLSCVACSQLQRCHRRDKVRTH